MHFLLLILIQLLSSINISCNGSAQTSLVHRRRITKHISCNKPEELKAVVSSRIDGVVIGAANVPTLTPFQQTDAREPRKQRFAGLIGGIGAALLIFLILGFVYRCLMRIRRRLLRQTVSETMSSCLSSPQTLQRISDPPYAGSGSSLGMQNLRELTIQEIDHATNCFSQNNIMGEGLFGLVYKGMLQDGSIVAVKRRTQTHNLSFIHEVNRLARVQHKNLVKIIGYHEDSHKQILVSEYVQNGDVGLHLYESEGLPVGKLNILQRLLIALDTAQGLEYLHSLDPPILHMHFRTRNVLLDENFTARVSDYGLCRLVSEDDHRAGPSSAPIDSFLDPQLTTSSDHSPASDVYSFGVFLLELVSGREANSRNSSNPDQTFLSQAKACERYAEFIDERLGDHATEVAEEMMELALQCTDDWLQRPRMTNLVRKLKDIQETRFGNFYVESEEEIGPVTLGSELFR